MGVTVVLGDMDVARVSPYRPGRVNLHCTHPLPRGGGTRGLPLTGERRLPDPDKIRSWGDGAFGECKKRDRLRAECVSGAATPARPAQLTAFHGNLSLPRRSRKTLHAQLAVVVMETHKCGNSDIYRNRYRKCCWSLGQSM